MWRSAIIGMLFLAAAGCGSSGGGGDASHPPPTEKITLTLVGPFNATPEGNNWVVAGTSAFTILATGTGFTDSCAIEWNGSPLPTQFGSSTGLAATVAGNFIALPGSAAIQVKDAATGVVSNALPFGIASSAAAAAGVIQMITAAPDGTPADADSLVAPSISATGRFISFQSAADNLVPGHPASGYEEIYERDTCIAAPSGCVPTTVPISVTWDGSPPSDPSRVSAISADGRYVAFDSDASNILNFSQAQAMCPQLSCAYVRDTCIGAPSGCQPGTTLVSVGLDGSPNGGGDPSISPDGRYVGYESTGTAPGTANIYLRDTCNGAPSGCTPSTILVSATYDGQAANALSVGQSGGRFVTFDSYATNLIPNDNNIWPDVFLRDTCTGAQSPCTPSTTRVSVSTSGAQANGAAESNGWQPSITADGRLIAWFSAATNMVSQNVMNGVYVRDTCFAASAGCAPATTLASLGNDGSLPNLGQKNQAMSGNGRFIAFGSLASNLVPGDTFPPGDWEDIFVRDTCFGAAAGCTPSTVRVSVANYPSAFAVQSNAVNDDPAISADGHYVVFLSAATNYLPSGGNGHSMVYLARTGF